MLKQIPRYTLSVVWLAVILILCWLPKSNIIEPNWFSFPNQDKVVHFILFFVWVYFLQIDFKYRKIESFWLFALSLGLVFACISEYFQPIVSNRTCDWQDALADMLGVTVGLILFKKTK